ncbi:putative RING finger protein [Wickerhamomyces ciferrii]|uniref:RING finger protein n=1 Tax=Wickerhamomyces ciferrii (strain ATCC 14091 / BCRC 22168 / CBS 111 / JCM 3599 / NBRC 0793 / NRRL Y-1031 F-60-10) TaxID=1206466 RepID=K0KWB7_WICCF|nr:putative RING finger protein [Wickerhamomyces ciferrii]CCH45774.1 putative RING finger protein [Wickerhamomyces ciferrii]
MSGNIIDKKKEIRSGSGKNGENGIVEGIHDDRIDGNEADLEKFSSSGSESEMESDNQDPTSRDLESIGRFTNFKMPNFWNNINLYNPYNKEDANSNVNVQTISRREQLSNLIEDLKSGFSLQSALDRFQTIRSALESSVDEAIDNSAIHGDEDEEENYEPHVITAAVEPKDIPMLDQVIIPEDKDPRNHSSSHSKHTHRKKKKKSLKKVTLETNSEVEELTNIPQDHESNDEMFLRNRIKKIRRLDISELEKNRLTQKLMMGAHYDKIRFVDDNGDEVLQITADQQTQTINNKEQDKGKEQESSEEGEEGYDYEEDDDDDEDIVIVNEEDKEPTYHNEDQDIFGCPHYQRNCKMECPRCKKWFGCPICHDESISGHKFKRENTRHIMCLKCFAVQEPSEFCEDCDIQFASYYCSKCKLYDNDDFKDIYHCDDCGICRLGLGLGQDFFHCKGCNACLSIELQDDHRCIERATQSDCPICGEYMFTSVKPVVFMSCGHAIHQSCYEDHSKHSYKCPTCQKTVLNMEAQFRVLDMEISLQPLPQPYCQWTCVISCNDCNAKSSCAYHVLGLKCDNCKSYNTVQLKLIKPEESDYDSDISTTTNQLRNRSGFSNLRNIPINSSNLLNTNYNIELNTTLSSGAAGAGISNGQGIVNPIIPSSQSNEGSTNLNSAQQSNLNEGRILTLPQQLLQNFDTFVQSIQDSSSEDDESDEQDFLRVNKSLKNRFKSDGIFSDSKDNTPEPDQSNEGDNNIDNNDKDIDETTGPVQSFTGALREFLASGSLVGMIDDMNNESDELIDSDENINGF